MPEINLLDKNGGTVSAFQDAQLRHFIKGNDYTGNTIGGVLNGIGSSFGYELNQSNKTIAIKDGVGLLYGRRFSIPPGESIIFNLASFTGTKKITIYVVMDTRDSTAEKVTIEMDVATINYSTIDRGDNLATKALGIARMVLYQFMYNSTASSAIYTPERRFYLLDPNIVEQAKKALTLPADSTINGRVVSNIVNSNKDSVKRADSSDSTLAINGNKVDGGLAVTSVDSSKIIMIKHFCDNISISVDESKEESIISYTTTNARIIAVIVDFKLFYTVHYTGYWAKEKEKGYIHDISSYLELKDKNKELSYYRENGSEENIYLTIEGGQIRLKAKTTTGMKIRLAELNISAIVEKA